MWWCFKTFPERPPGVSTAHEALSDRGSADRSYRQIRCSLESGNSTKYSTSPETLGPVELPGDTGVHGTPIDNQLGGEP